MASWYSSISSNITKLQRTIFAGENDGDTEDDTHVCRVLRNYYLEVKSQPLPNWLPPDPKAPPPAQPVLANSQQTSRYGNFNSSQQGGGGGQLSSLWDNGGGKGQQQQGGHNAGNRNPFAASGGGQQQPDPRQAVPQSLRAGGYQSTGGRVEGVSSPSPSVSSAQSGVSAQEKLKQRLWGGARTTSPNSGGPFQPPAQQQAPAPQQSSGGGSRWGASWGAGQGAAANESGYGRRNDQPVLSANAPWADGGFDYPAGGAGGSSGGGGRSYGLPSGPRGGLPSGPRPR
ncbi:Sec1-binding region of Mso1-domain-containing protein [Podospora fimiseda]|uniref:Sec1-binding region of Mso1-domain-containing protein n=1 Tax=Podospora fimiseda TaxID=252190 RepID=A0AAN7BL87_9PEZI|nr:Sec1-binding region of Mso1-domain-containing protein [Podospora fimiseda]